MLEPGPLRTESKGERQTRRKGCLQLTLNYARFVAVAQAKPEIEAVRRRQQQEASVRG